MTEELQKDLYEKMRQELIWDLKVMFLDFSRFNQFKDQVNVDIRTIQKQLHDQVTAISKQVADL